MCKYNVKPEDFDDYPVRAASVEPMPRPDYRAKKRPKPAPVKHKRRPQSMEKVNA